jgi:glycine/sarcosine N-methyltransferase
MTTAYDAFSSDYDRFVNWPGRLAAELPFLQQTLRAAGARRVLDAACGTGMHAVALAQNGFSLAGADLSAGMVERARANAAAAQVQVPFVAAGFGHLAGVFRAQEIDSFDAVLCLGNSLPHLLDVATLTDALDDFMRCLRPDGVLVLQNRNFDAVLAQRERWMEPQSHHEGEREWIFLRFYDYDPDGLITFNILMLYRETQVSPWQQALRVTRLRPLRQVELIRMVAEAGFGEIACYGSLGGEVFDPLTSGNLVVTARKKSG